MSAPPSRQHLLRQVAGLTRRLREAEDALAAIREGDVDAIVVSGKRGERIFSLTGTDLVYRLIVESMQEAALTTTTEGRILYCNQQLSSMLTLPFNALVGRKLADLVEVKDHPVLEALLLAAQSRPARVRVSFRGATGTIPSLVSASYLQQPEGPSICIVAADISDLEAADAHLRRSNDELLRSASRLRGLAGELVQAEERERRRLASALHDGLQQLLVGAQLHMHKAISESGKQPGRSSRRVVELLDQSIEMSRSLALEISPPIRFSSGLAPAFKWLARSISAKYSLAVRLTEKGEVDPAGEEISIFLFRAVQELLLNVVKHSGAKSADLRLEAGKNQLSVSVSDKGRGFDPEKAANGFSGSGYGLFSIRERLSLLGGRMEVRSSPKTGSSFTLVVPLASVRPGGEKAAPPDSGGSRRRAPVARRRPPGRAGAKGGAR